MKESTFKKYCLVIDEWFVNGFNGVKAYQKFYTKASDNAADVGFRKIYGIVRIKEYIKSKRELLIEGLDITLKRQLFELEELKDLSKLKTKYRDSIEAIKEQNRLLGFYEIDNLQKEPSVSHLLTLSPSERAQRIIELRRQINESNSKKSKKRRV